MFISFLLFFLSIFASSIKTIGIFTELVQYSCLYGDLICLHTCLSIMSNILFIFSARRCNFILAPVCLALSLSLPPPSFTSPAPTRSHAGGMVLGSGRVWVWIILPSVGYPVWVIPPDIRHVQVSTNHPAGEGLPPPLPLPTPLTSPHKEKGTRRSGLREEREKWKGGDGCWRGGGAVRQGGATKNNEEEKEGGGYGGGYF